MTARLKKAQRGREHAGCTRHCLYLLMCFVRQSRFEAYS